MMKKAASFIPYNRTRSWLTWLFLIFVVPFSMHAQFAIDNIKRLSIKEGLSNDFVFSVTQDKLDLVWIGTESGLNRFDGQTVKKYYFNKEDPHSLSNNLIQALYADDKNLELWVATDAGLNKYNYEKDCFEHYLYKQNGVPIYNDIIDIIPHDSTHLWLASYCGGVHLFNKKTGKIEWQKKLFKQAAPNTCLSTKSLYQDKQQNLWIGTVGKGVYKYQIKTGKVEHYSIKSSEAGVSLLTNRFFEDANGTIWIATSNGIHYYDPKQDQFIAFKKLTFLHQTQVYFIQQVKNNQIWIGTENGIYIITPDKLQNNSSTPVYEHIAERDDSHGLSFRSVRSIYEDKYKNLWIATYAGGVNYLPYTAPKFKIIKKNSDQKNTLSYNKTLSLCQGTDGALYFGTDGYGINKVDVNHKTIRPYSFNKGGRINWDIVQTIYCDNKDILWIGTYDGGLIRYNQKTNRQQIINTQNSTLPGNDVRAIKEDNKGFIWVGCTGGLCKIDKQGNIHETYTLNNSTIGNEYIRHLELDAQGNWWIATYNKGLIYFEVEDKRFTSYKNNSTLPGSIPDNSIDALCLSQNGNVWVATKNGDLSCLKKTSTHFTIYTGKEGVPRDIIRIVEDNSQKLWLCSSSTITRFDPVEFSFETFQTKDVTEVGMYFASAGMKSKTGEIYFGGSNGVIYFNPQVFVQSSLPALRPIITNFQLYNQTVPISTDTLITPLKKSILLTNEIVLAHNQSQITIHYVSPNYGFIDDLKYAYMLEGEDTQWNQVGNKTFADYRNLAPGKYSFKVKVSNQDGVWNVEPTSLRITIQPPFWKLPIMYVIYIILTLLAIYTSLRIITYRIRTHNRLKILRLEKAKSEELYQAKLQFFTNISHEFRTPLTLISSPIDKILELENDHEKIYLLSIVKKSSDRMLRLVNQLLDLRRLDRNGLRLHVEQAEIIGFISKTLSSFEEYSLKKDIALSIEKQHESFLLWFDHEIINKCLYNILSNAFKFTPEGGSIQLVCGVDHSSQKNESFFIRVKDTGVGIKKEYLSKIFDRFYQVETGTEKGLTGSGIGLHLVKELITLHHGRIAIESTPGVGTQFSIYLPIAKSAYKKEEFATKYQFESQVNNQSKAADLSQEKEADKNVVQRPTSGASPTKHTILIVEDEANVLEYLVYELKNDYNILTASNGVIATQLIKEKQVDLIISDVMMPLMDGLELCSTIKNDVTTCHIPFVLLTAKASIENKIEGVGIGVDDYISKPFDMNYLRTRTKSLIEQRERLSKKFSRNILLEIAKEKENSECSPDNQLLLKAVELVKLEMANSELNGEFLAKKLNMSRVHLHRKLKALTNLSSSEFIRNIRLDYSLILLRNRQLNISEISYETGFSSPAYYSSCFTKYFGISPSEFLKQEESHEPSSDTTVCDS